MTISTFGALIVSDPQAARSRILAALTEARGERSAAARALGLATPRTLYRWIERLGMWAEVDALVAERGFDQLPAPPRTRDKVLRVLEQVGGDFDAAARALGVKRATLGQRITQLNLDGELKRIRREHGDKS